MNPLGPGTVFGSMELFVAIVNSKYTYSLPLQDKSGTVQNTRFIRSTPVAKIESLALGSDCRFGCFPVGVELSHAFICERMEHQLFEDFVRHGGQPGA